jgi:azurin
MKTKTNSIIAASLFAFGCLQAQPCAVQPFQMGPMPMVRAAPADTAAPLASALPPKDTTLVVDIAINDTVSFSVTKIVAHAGQKITVHLKDSGKLPKSVMAHNWILLKPGTDVFAYAAAAAADKAENFQPKALANEVLAAIPMIGAGESGEITFTSPKVPGTYTYICSCYGHAFAGMRGVLVVI